MKRETKKDVYKRYGIEYKGNKLYCEPLEKWVNPMLPIGTNTKVGDAATWSIYHGNETLTPDMFGEKARAVMANAGISEIKASCPMHCDGCYCDSGFYCYDSTKAVNLQKLVLARMYPDWLERAIMAQVEADSKFELTGSFKMNVKELKEKLSTFPDDMEVMTKKTELLGTVGYIFSVKQDSYALFGVDIPCVLISDESG